MFSRLYVIAAVLMGLLALPATSHAVDLCHVANAGFLIKGDNASVLIDGLIMNDNYQGRFALPSAGMQKQMMNREGLFENLSVVVATHRHGDHFDPEATAAHISRNPGTRYVFPADTRETLTAAGVSAHDMQRVTFAPDNQQSRYQFDDTVIEVYDVDHGPNMPQNNGYRVTVDGKSFFHTGDINTTRGQLAASGMNGLKVDMLLIPFWFGLNDADQRSALDTSWSYARIIPMHFPVKAAPWMEQFGGIEGLKQTAADAYNNAHILAEEGACIPVE